MSYPLVKLGEVMNILSGFAFKSELFGKSDGFPIIRIRDVVRGYTDTYYSGSYAQQYVIQNGEIVIGMDGNFNAARWIGGPALLNQRVCKVSAKRELLDDGYLFHYLPTVLKKIEDSTPFVTVKHLSSNDLKDSTIPLPPLPKQRRIAAILDKADTLRTKRREALAQLDRLAQSIFIEIFGDPTQNPNRWPTLSLEKLIETGPQNGLYKPANEYGEGVPILRIDAFYDGAVTKMTSLKRLRVTNKELELYGLKKNDLVINRVNSLEYLGKSALIPELPEPTVFESNMMRFSINTDIIHPIYLISFLQDDFIKRQVLSCAKNAVNQSSINQQDVKNLQIVLPPRPLQQNFVTRLQAIENLKIQHRAALAELDALFTSLQHRAFRGEL